MPDPLVVRREAYIKYLYGLESALRSNDPNRAANARQMLARLRHSFVEGKQYQAYEIVFRQDPPEDSAEVETWLLVGGLFALHPLNWRGSARPRSLGASLGRLQKKLDSPAVDRRLSLLLAKDIQALPHHLRQTIRLLSAHDVPVHYGRLLDDLVVLLGRDHRGDKASKVRLKWAQEYYMPVSATTDEDSDEPSTDLPEKTK
ncbi:type I-E CRISPR-associated protein Cse2/CasB [Sphaerisporangium sp. NPDC049003]|uniref:type I-E CRISPR-associated protein Cse2/CasB n=1 Tax=Sphaerisporangium sp. NPDC049003 TaxID=3364517 RepID=UPI00371FC7AA